MCPLAFFAFLRISELTPIQVVSLANASTRMIHRQLASCPIQLPLDYLALRGNQQGSIFLTQVRTPVTMKAFALQLANVIRFCGLDPARYKGHSFRIGAASYAAEQGMSDS